MKKSSSSLLNAEPGSPGISGSESVPATYEAALEELEKLVRQLEGGQMPLDQLLTGYQRGALLLKFCRDKLDAVEQQVKVLDSGELKPWAQD
jgi:exodeoxyribonuclease VII small subunit